MTLKNCPSLHTIITPYDDEDLDETDMDLGFLWAPIRGTSHLTKVVVSSWIDPVLLPLSQLTRLALQEPISVLDVIVIFVNSPKLEYLHVLIKFDSLTDDFDISSLPYATSASLQRLSVGGDPKMGVLSLISRLTLPSLISLEIGNGWAWRHSELTLHSILNMIEQSSCKLEHLALQFPLIPF
ncbi:hypothetical protein L218DRAFT_251954 [Marasmius fiardii PR-910]|nr:hypothetical protein L218DRAFT_251954 [Marasmius fiardii PR-910]